jgi:hypothetical protein
MKRFISFIVVCLWLIVCSAADATIFLKQSTPAVVCLGYFMDDTDGKTPEVALVIPNTQTKLHKSNALVRLNKSDVNSAVHMADGTYYATLDATDTDTLGPLTILIRVTGALSKEIQCLVVTANAYDLLCGSGNVNTNVQKWGDVVVPPNAFQQ